MTVAILGCGPAGLLAAHACARASEEFFIYSIKKKSSISGAQYIHVPIPGINSVSSPDGLIVYSKVGDRDVYARKVYGSPNVPVSWDKFNEGIHEAWSMQRTYNFLWDEFNKEVEHTIVTPRFVKKLSEVHELVICAIQLPGICEKLQEHKFHKTTVWIREGAPIQEPRLDMNVIIYNGDPNVPWYRASNLFGHESVEFGHHVRRAVRGFKPTGTDCDCHPNMLRVGRFGNWTRGILAHDGFQRTEDAIQMMKKEH